MMMLCRALARVLRHAVNVGSLTCPTDYGRAEDPHCFPHDFFPNIFAHPGEFSIVYFLTLLSAFAHISCLIDRLLHP
jgi:hypothetical protein